MTTAPGCATPGPQITRTPKARQGSFSATPILLHRHPPPILTFYVGLALALQLTIDNASATHLFLARITMKHPSSVRFARWALLPPARPARTRVRCPPHKLAAPRLNLAWISSLAMSHPALFYLQPLHQLRLSDQALQTRRDGLFVRATTMRMTLSPYAATNMHRGRMLSRHYQRTRLFAPRGTLVVPHCFSIAARVTLSLLRVIPLYVSLPSPLTVSLAQSKQALSCRTVEPLSSPAQERSALAAPSVAAEAST